MGPCERLFLPFMLAYVIAPDARKRRALALLDYLFGHPVSETVERGGN